MDDISVLTRLKADRDRRNGYHGPPGHECRCQLCDSIREIERLRRFAEWAAGASCDDEYAPRLVKHIAENAAATLENAPVAQSEEHRNSTSGVAGSSPAGSAK